MNTTMSDNSLNCVFCGEKTFDRIIKFKSETLKKCKTVLEYRRSKPVLRKSRGTFNNVEISDETLKDGYHAQCYKLFTAIKIPSDFQNQQENEPIFDCEREISGDDSELLVPVTSTTTQVASTSTDEAEVSIELEQDFEDSGADEPVGNEDLPLVKCFICEKTRKRHRGREVPLAVNKIRTIVVLKNAATEHNDIEMLEKISSFSDDSNNYYHKCCKDHYLRDISKSDESEFVKKRKASITAFALLCEMVEEYVVNKNECLSFDHVKNQYHKLLEEQCKQLSDPISSTAFSDRYLQSKLMDTFDRKVKIIYAQNKTFLAPISTHIVMKNDLFKP